MTVSKQSRLAVVALLVALPVACSDDDSATSDTVAPTVAPATTEAPTTTEAPAPEATEVPVVNEWEEIVAPADCMCSDGSEFSFFVRKADPAKVMFFFQGGGACFDVEGCDPANRQYLTSVNGPGDSTLGEGVFDFDNSLNPFADFSVVYVPYCTGDVHIGNSVHDYGVSAAGNNVVINHNGYVNGTTALATLVELFPDATEVVVAGESAGAVPTPLYAGLVHDELPDARITVLADGSGAYPDVPAINAFVGGLWGTTDARPDWPVAVGLTPEEWSIPGLFIVAGAHAPGITFARHDYAYDETQVFFGNLAGFDADNLVELIDLNESQIEASGIQLFSYISPGDSHTVLSRPGFYTEMLNDVALYNWVTLLVRGMPVVDVHCNDCVTVS